MGEEFHLSSNDFCILNSLLTRLRTGRYALDYLGTTGYRHTVTGTRSDLRREFKEA